PADATPRRHRVALATPAPCVGVVAAPRDALAVGAAVALSLAHPLRTRCEPVCAWPPGGWAEPALHGPAGVAARQLRRNLAARGLDATAAGKLGRGVLPDATENADRGAERALGAGSSPSVLLLAGPRPEALDEVLLR